MDRIIYLDGSEYTEAELLELIRQRAALSAATHKARRDELAAAAMPAILSGVKYYLPKTYGEVAEEAYRFADALIAQGRKN